MPEADQVLAVRAHEGKSPAVSGGYILLREVRRHPLPPLVLSLGPTAKQILTVRLLCASLPTRTAQAGPSVPEADQVLVMRAHKGKPPAVSGRHVLLREVQCLSLIHI